MDDVAHIYPSIHLALHPTSIHPSINENKKNEPTREREPTQLHRTLCLATSLLSLHEPLSLAAATTHAGIFRRAPATGSSPPSSPSSTPPSHPSRIRAPALHRPPWLARVSAATSSPATASPAAGGSGTVLSQHGADGAATTAGGRRPCPSRGDGGVGARLAGSPVLLEGRGGRGLLLWFHRDRDRCPWRRWPLDCRGGTTLSCSRRRRRRTTRAR